MSTEKLGDFLREVSNWSWEEFVRAEHDDTYTSNQAVIFSLVRACVMQKMEAIRMSLNRLDGKLKTPVKIEYPKVFYLFPNVKGYEIEDPGVTQAAEKEVPIEEIKKVEAGEIITTKEAEQTSEDVSDLPSLSLRETVAKMSDYPRNLPLAIIQKALEVEMAINAQDPMPDEVPRVKSVVAAHLLTMAANRNMGALSEVFDQIDGKLVETLQILDDDLYITSYATEAPAGGHINEDGIYQIEATAAQNIWAAKLARELG